VDELPADPISDIRVFPNPNNGSFNVVSKEKIKLTLIDNIGQIVQTIELNERNHFQEKIQIIGSGIYFISGQSANGSFNQKIIVTQ
jgi:hypothetical protein